MIQNETYKYENFKKECKNFFGTFLLTSICFLVFFAPMTELLFTIWLYLPPFCFIVLLIIGVSTTIDPDRMRRFLATELNGNFLRQIDRDIGMV